MLKVWRRTVYLEVRQRSQIFPRCSHECETQVAHLLEIVEGDLPYLSKTSRIYYAGVHVMVGPSKLVIACPSRN
jgi:hypothetical protein